MTNKHGLFDFEYLLIDFETVDIPGVNQGGIDSEWFNYYILENTSIANPKLSGSRFSRYFELIRIERRDSCA